MSKTTYIAPNTPVKIKDIDTIGVVREVSFSNTGTQYKVSYWLNGKREEVWVYVDEIVEIA